MSENITNIPAPRVPLIDERTGLMSREWFRFFVNLFYLTGAGQSGISITDLAIQPVVQDTSTLANLGPETQLASMMARYDDAMASIQGAYLAPVIPTQVFAFDPTSFCAPRVEIGQAGALSVPIGVAYGGTGANLSATGGASQYVKQLAVGDSFTVGAIAAGDLTGTASALSIGGNAATATTATNQSGGTVNATTGAFSGAVTVGSNAAVSSSITNTAAGGAGQGAYYAIASAGVTKSYFGAYAVIFGGGTDQSLLLHSVADNAILNAASGKTSSLAVNFTNIVAATSTGAAVTGSLQVSGLGAFASGDKYVIVDSSGNFHKSALGPAS